MQPLGLPFKFVSKTSNYLIFKGLSWKLLNGIPEGTIGLSNYPDTIFYVQNIVEGQTVQVGLSTEEEGQAKYYITLTNDDNIEGWQNVVNIFKECATRRGVSSKKQVSLRLL